MGPACGPSLNLSCMFLAAWEARMSWSWGAVRHSGRSLSRAERPDRLGWISQRLKLGHARRLMGEAGIAVPVVHASGEHVPFADESFDVVVADYGRPSSRIRTERCLRQPDCAAVEGYSRAGQQSNHRRLLPYG